MRRRMVLGLILAMAACSKKDEAEHGKGKEASAEQAHEEKHIEEANVVEFSLEAQKRAGIAVEAVRISKVGAHIKATGTVQAVDSRVAHLRPLARGRVLQVMARVGDRVEKDQALVSYDNIEAGEVASQRDGAQAEAQRIRIQLATARRQAERAKSLLAIGAVPAKEAEAAESDAKALEENLKAQQSVVAGLEARLRRFGVSGEGGDSTTSIRAPFRGVVTSVTAAPGDVVDASTALLQVADLSRVSVEAQVYEKDLGKIRLQQLALITVDTFPGEVFEGRVTAIKDILDPQTRTATVRCELPNPAGRLRLEMFANLTVPTMETHDGLTVPQEAVQTINQRQVVFVRKSELHFEAREVQVVGEGTRLEIPAGLKGGEPVVVKGAYQLKSAFLAKELEREHDHD